MQALFDALRVRTRAKTDLTLTLGPETARTERAIAAMRKVYDDVFQLCRVQLTCCTPTACHNACALLRVIEPFVNMDFGIFALPRPDGERPQTDAWLWDAMQRATCRFYGEDTLLRLFGGCERNGRLRGDERHVHNAGRHMGSTNATTIKLMFHSADTAWMAPFIRGFSTVRDTATRRVELCARWSVYRAKFPQDGDEDIADYFKEGVDRDLNDIDDDIADAIREANALTPNVTWKCTLGPGDD